MKQKHLSIHIFKKDKELEKERRKADLIRISNRNLMKANNKIINKNNIENSNIKKPIIRKMMSTMKTCIKKKLKIIEVKQKKFLLKIKI